MENPFCLIIPLLLLTFGSRSRAQDTLYPTFVQCLAKNAPRSAQNISSIVYTRANASYDPTLRSSIKNRRFNTTATPKPVIIVTPLAYEHVQATVLCAKASNIQVKTRSGGHDYEGLSYVSSEPKFILLDLFNLRKINVDVNSETAFVQAGALLGELYYNIWKKSKVHGFPAGVCPTVGVGGHISGGGYGTMIRKFGLSVDNVLDAEIVDVNGRVLNRKSMGEDLFWAIRGGGGGSFGVVLSYTLKLVRVPETVSVFRVMRTVEENATDLVYKWQSAAPTTDNNLFMRLLLQPGDTTVKVTVMALFLGDSNTLLGVTGKDLPELGLKKEDVTEMSWIESVLFWSNFDNTTLPDVLLNRHSDKVSFGKRKSDYVMRPIPKEGLESLWKKMMELGKIGLVFNAYGGRIYEIPATATPFPHRAGNLFKIQYSISWQDEKLEKDYLNQARVLYSFMTPYVSSNPRAAFLNYRDLEIGTRRPGQNSYQVSKVYGEKYFMGNYDRLVKIKNAVDPDNFFRHEQSVPSLK